MLMCDFCSTKNPIWSYAAKSFTAFDTETLDCVSTGNWAACDECRILIDAGDLKALAARSFEAMLHQDVFMVAFKAEVLAGIHNDLQLLMERFSAHRISPLHQNESTLVATARP